MILVLSSIIVLLLINVIIFFSLKRMDEECKNETYYVNISVIIAAKNEVENIPDLIRHLKNIDYPEELFEVIIVDDNSVDDTLNLLNSFSESLKNLSIFKMNHTLAAGKRDALSFGISKSKFEKILITDADCRPESDWLKAYSKKFQEGFDLLFGIAPFYQHKNLINNISCFENLRNSILSFSMAYLSLPYSAAARNFGFTKKAFESIGGFLKTKNKLSGDDDLFMREAVKKKMKIGIVTEKGSYVYSETKKTLGEYLQQKARHIQTSFHYLKRHQLMLAFWHSLNLFFLFSPMLMILNPLFGILLPVKFLFDIVIVKLFQKKIGYNFSVIKIVYLQILYELFLIVNFINARFTEVKWKQ